MARRTGRSEAQLLRQAVERLVASEPVAAALRLGSPVREDPVIARNQPGPGLVGVGMGPGDPGLVTPRAVEVLRGADRVLAPTTSASAVGRAEAIVREAVPDVAVERVVFVMETDGAARSAALAAVAERVVALLDVGRWWPSSPSATPACTARSRRWPRRCGARRPGVPIETVPGIMAFQDLAARAGTVLVDGARAAGAGAGPRPGGPTPWPPRRPPTPPPPSSSTRAAPACPSWPPGWPGPVGWRVRCSASCSGLPGGRVAAVADVADRPATYLATLVVPPVRGRNGDGHTGTGGA